MHEQHVASTQVQAALEVAWIVTFILVAPGFLLAGYLAGGSESAVLTGLITITVNACFYGSLVFASMLLMSLFARLRNRTVSWR